MVEIEKRGREMKEKRLCYVTFSVDSRVEVINSVCVEKYWGAIVAGANVVQPTISKQ